MSTLVTDPSLSASLIADRRSRGADRFDEVWDGVYVMAPAPNDEHQSIATRLARIFVEVIEDSGLGQVRNAINLASDFEDWSSNFRVPDLAVFLTGSKAVCHGAVWTGSPDFVVEVVSPFDQTREKLDFYKTIGTRELLIVDREPWQLELLRLKGRRLTSTGIVDVGAEAALVSESTQLAFRLIPGPSRPVIAVRHSGDGRSWEA
jgi:Uma2 family endonuclease